MDRFNNKYRISSARLQNWNYGWNAAYFATICTKNREHFFGKIENDEIHLSATGQFAYDFWHEIPDHFNFVKLGAFQVMPNHIHGIVIIDKPFWDNNDYRGAEHKIIRDDDDGNVDGNAETRHCLISARNTNDPGDTTNPADETDKTKNNQSQKTIGQKRFQNQGSNTLSSILGSYKSVVTKNARKINPCFGWQSRFHDHVIRNSASFHRITKYIINNPKSWKNDSFH